MTDLHPTSPRRRPAQSMLEFALIVPVLFLFILGIIEMGYALFVYASVQNAAREGARAAAVLPCSNSNSTIISATSARLPALVNTSTVEGNTSIVYSTGSGATADFGDTVTVTVDYTFPLLDPLVQSFIPQVHVRAVAARDITTGCGSTQAEIPTLTPTPVNTPTTAATTVGTPTSTATSVATATPVTPTATPVTPTATPCTLLSTSLSLTPGNGNSVTLNWGAVAGATQYNLYKKEGTGSYSSIYSGTGTSTSDTLGGSNGTVSTYYVTVVNACGAEGSASGTVSGTK